MYIAPVDVLRFGWDPYRNIRKGGKGLIEFVGGNSFNSVVYLLSCF